MSKKVLVVDDQPLPRQALCNELLDVGFEVEQADDGEQGWQVFQTTQPDVVVTDLTMPHSDGLELLSRIRGSSEVPVILFSAYGTVQSTAAAFKAGAHDFLSSTEIEIEDLVSQIKRAAEHGDPKASDLTTRIQPLFAGKSTLMCDLRGRLSALASFPIPVFLVGPPGSGRDQAFRILHDMGHTEGEDFAILKPQSAIPDFDTLTPGSIYLDGLEDFSAKKATKHGPSALTGSKARGSTRPHGFLSPVGGRSPTGAARKPSVRGWAGTFSPRPSNCPPSRTTPKTCPRSPRFFAAGFPSARGRRVRLSPAANPIDCGKDLEGRSPRT